MPLLNVALWFYLAGIFTCTWDFRLTLDLGGFTLKIHQGLFLASFLLTVFSVWRGRGFRSVLKPLGTTFAASALGLAGLYLVELPRSYFPLKTFFYAGWIIYNFFTIYVGGMLLAREVGAGFAVRGLRTTALFLSAILFIDQIAYQFGYVNGFIGFNQDSVLHWGVSRPHAFSSEPSYVATFLCLVLVLTNHLFTPTRRGIDVLGDMAIAVAVFLTTSRTGAVGLAFGFVLSLALAAISSRRLPWRPLLAGLAVAVVCAGGFFASMAPAQRSRWNENLFSSVITGKDGSGNSRIRAHYSAYLMAKETSWLGTGLGASYRYWTQTRPAEANNDGSQENGKEVVMSIWGEVLAEGGLPGIILYFALAGSLARSLWRRWRTHHSPLLTGALASTILFFGFLAFWLGNVARGDVWVWYAAWAILAAYPTSAKVASRNFS